MDDDSLLALVAMTFIFLIVCLKLFLRARYGYSGKRHRQNDEEEAMLMQDMNRELERIEQRVEALETILLEKGSVRSQASPSEGAR